VRREPAPGAAIRAPFVVDSPHSGRRYPTDFGHTLPHATMRRAEDAWVDELIWDAPSFGASFLAAEFPRAYVDPNRHEHDLDGALMDEPLPAHAAPTYRSEWAAYHRPYHDALGSMLDGAHRDFACVYHLNCHSMLSKGRGIARPDFVLSDGDGETCDVTFRDFVRERLEAMGYGVAINDPFKGGEIVRRYGRPHERRHSLQIEIRRGLYMDEKRVEKSDGFDAIKAALSELIDAVAQYARAK
jgi:N-formylglutamate deformylase